MQSVEIQYGFSNDDVSICL